MEFNCALAGLYGEIGHVLFSHQPRASGLSRLQHCFHTSCLSRVYARQNKEAGHKY